MNKSTGKITLGNGEELTTYVVCYYCFYFFKFIQPMQIINLCGKPQKSQHFNQEQNQSKYAEKGVKVK